jgi:hypothetical protein
MNTLAPIQNPPAEIALNDRVYAAARYVAKLVQGSQILEAASLDAAGYERLVETAAKMLREGDPRKLGAGS